jgi:hypothetical protein
MTTFASTLSAAAVALCFCQWTALAAGNEDEFQTELAAASAIVQDSAAKAAAEMKVQRAATPVPGATCERVAALDIVRLDVVFTEQSTGAEARFGFLYKS